MSVHRIHRPVFAVLLVLVAGSTLAAEPPVDDSAKLKEYEVGNSKTLPKSDDAVSKVERPKADIVGRFQFEMPVLEVVPMVVAPMTVSPAPAPAAAAPTVKPAISAPIEAGTEQQRRTEQGSRRGRHRDGSCGTSASRAEFRRGLASGWRRWRCDPGADQHTRTGIPA